MTLNKDQAKELFEKLTKEYYKNEYLFDGIINIFMVYFGFRNSCLLEPSNIISGSFNDLIKYIETLGLKYHLDKTKRILVYKKNLNIDVNKMNTDDTYLGKLLGFYCYNHINYYNGYLDRVVAQINIFYKGKKYNVYSEVCEKSILDNTKSNGKLKKHISKLTDKYNEMMGKDFNASYDIRDIIGHETIIKNFDDYNFVMKNKIDIIDDFENNLVDGITTELLRNGKKSDIMKSLKFIKYLYQKAVIEEKFIKLYPVYTGTKDNIKKINDTENIIREEEEKLWKIFNKVLNNQKN